MVLAEIEADAFAERRSSAAPLRPWFFAAVLALCGLLILTHLGCHGDEDTELFGRLDRAAESAVAH